MNSSSGSHPPRRHLWWHARSLLRWFGLPADPPLRAPAVARPGVVRRPWVLAAWDARAAVLAGSSLHEFLRSRLAQYHSELSVPRSLLPVWIEVIDGEIRAASSAPPAPPASATEATAPEAKIAALAALEGPWVLREWTELRARLASLELETAAARRRSAELSERFHDDVARGELPAAPRLDDTPEQLGRPPVRGPAPGFALVSFAVLAVLGQAYAIAVPALSAVGGLPLVVPGAPRTWALETAVLCLFSLGISVALLALALVALRLRRERLADATPHRRWRAHRTALLVALAGATTAAAAATLPAPRSGVPAPSQALLLLAISVGAALLLERARVAAAARAADLAAALAWDRDRARALSDRARRAEQVAWAEADAEELDRRRGQAAARVEQLTRRSARAALLLARAEQTRRSDRLRLARSLGAALERDRYEFVRQATARGATDLLPGARRLDSEVRPIQAGRDNLGRMAG